MTATQVELPMLPDELELAEFKLVLNIESKDDAHSRAIELLAKVSKEFAARHLALALLYDLEFTIARSRKNSWEFFGQAKLVLKKEWKALKRKSKTTFVVVSATVAAVAGYPDVRAGAIQIAEDAKSAYVYILDKEASRKGSDMGKYECKPTAIKPPPTHGH